MDFIGYSRVSDMEQIKTGYSIEAQEERILSWGQSTGNEIHRIFVEPGKSGVKPFEKFRPTFQQAVNTVLIGNIDGLVVVWIDRFARNVEDFLWVRSQFTRPANISYPFQSRY